MFVAITVDLKKRQFRYEIATTKSDFFNKRLRHHKGKTNSLTYMYLYLRVNVQSTSKRRVNHKLRISISPTVSC